MRARRMRTPRGQITVVVGRAFRQKLGGRNVNSSIVILSIFAGPGGGGGFSFPAVRNRYV
jgi:hypothetical protein